MPGTVASRIVAGAALAVASPLAAQSVTLADIAPRLRPGTIVRVTVDGVPIDGYLEQATADALVVRCLQPDRSDRLPTERLQQITYHDSVVNGAVTGLLAAAAPGVAFGFLMRTYCRNEAGQCDAAPLIFGALTGAVGWVIGAAIDEAIRTTVRLGPARVTATLGVVSDLRRPFARVSLRF